MPGFGDPSARILVLGLAPAAHGGNRTGRIFTGDRSGDFLFAALHRAGLREPAASTSVRRRPPSPCAYVSAVNRCAPPGNSPTPEERDRCLPFLARELALAAAVRVIVALGAFAWDGALRAIAGHRRAAMPRPKPRFGHGGRGDGRPLLLLGCFHPSQQNTFTGKLTPEMLDDVAASRAMRSPFDGPPAGMRALGLCSSPSDDPGGSSDACSDRPARHSSVGVLAVRARDAAPIVAATCRERGRCTITGTKGNDVLKGTEGSDVICGKGGADDLYGKGGDDQIYGGDGADDHLFGATATISCGAATAATTSPTARDRPHLGWRGPRLQPRWARATTIGTAVPDGDSSHGLPRLGLSSAAVSATTLPRDLRRSRHDTIVGGAGSDIWYADNVDARQLGGEQVPLLRRVTRPP